jgi:hypothetical protein
MATVKAIGGDLSVRLGDTDLSFSGELTYSFLVFKKTMQIGGDGKVPGFIKEAQVPFIEGTFFFDAARISTAQLEAVEGETLTAVLANGTQLALAGAIVAGDITPDMMKGTAKLRFEGTNGEEIV